MDPQRTDSVVQRVLSAGMQDSDLAAREAIQWYQRGLTAQDSVNANRPFSWYENVVQQVVQPTLAGPALGATLRTDRGTIRIELLGVEAPLTVFNFMELARKGFYTDLRLHRVVPNFVAQDGDPRGDGNGGPGYVIRDELNREPYARGAVGMATAGPNTAGSQYFLTLSPQPHLDGHYTLFGRVVMGLAAMDALVQGDIVKSITVP
jgi:cyclophilin family peptidyl-prolyl cis-trans isomerase